MIKQIIDLHLHSKYSRACSKNLDLRQIAKACEEKGIDIVSSADFTHPEWFKEIKENLVEINKTGLFRLKKSPTKTKFILGTEIACIKMHKGFCRRLHLCIFSPNLNTAEKFNKKLTELGFNLKSDGRPILGITAKELLILMKSIDKDMQMIPAHVWTPWFGLFGSKSGYDSLEECFEELSSEIFAVETGLSSDPYMNWQWSKLDKIALVSNSDAHSLEKIGREANVLNFKNQNEITYKKIFDIFKKNNKKEFLYTIEFFPEEGKYHFDGHINCNFSSDPEETKKLKYLCPVCKNKLTLGVSNRLVQLADRNKKDLEKIKESKIPFISAIPLLEIIADVYAKKVNSKIVKNEYKNILEKIGTEFYVLFEADIDFIRKNINKEIAKGIENVRKRKVIIKAGYDGKFGIIKIKK